ncbi:Fic family protein [Rubrivirga litoralis]|uniref:Fic family protein n=1 Tax=Rubrivirga litoralis TaxID=3075598 RepID=A0ABU3BR04_9BACT|nr:Fic family protein [Rubrivirga sp. F394]MDT0631726.1 Fic family protein [Rubrivirga sp. F394]
MSDPAMLGAAAQIERARALRDELDALRPLDPEQVGKAMQRLRLEWTYHSNAIEGNSLTYGETRALLMHGVTAQGKPLKDHLDIKGHREALDHLERLAGADEPLTLAAVRELHRVLLGEPYETWAETADGQRVRRTVTPGEFKAFSNSVKTVTGETHYYARPEETPALMTDLVDRYRAGWREVEQGGADAVVVAADLHHRFVAIHPFDDGNGRMARLLMNLVLMRAGYPPAVIRQENRPAYYGALAEADAGDLGPFVRFVADELTATLDLYLRALRGEPDPTAFSRRVALLRKEVETSGGSVERTPEALARITRGFVVPFLERVHEGGRDLASLFSGLDEFSTYAEANRPTKFLGNRDVDEVLVRADWDSFKYELYLRGYVEDPAQDVHLEVGGRSGRDHVVISLVGSQTPLVRVAYDQVIGDEEPAHLAEKVLERVVDQIEQLHRQAPGRLDSAETAPPSGLP